MGLCIPCYLFFIATSYTIHIDISTVKTLSSGCCAKSLFHYACFVIMFPFAKPKLLPRYANIPYTPLAEHSNPRQRFWKHVYKITSVLLVVAAVIATICLLHNPKLEHLQQPSAPIPVIPDKFRVVGLVFYGRRSRVEILDCYLKVGTPIHLRFSQTTDHVRSQQNLKTNGGLLDEVIFLARTDDVEDLAFLDQLVDETPGYSKNDLRDKNSRASRVTYGQAWEIGERGVMYIKIDDDIVSWLAQRELDDS